ncbi:hypothetical protein [Bacillus manliponensis]|uniref:hypothetical protein n=1 Tax=Bacillus manliponensis TaxID=574376 RepID=UPI0035162B85
MANQKTKKKNIGDSIIYHINKTDHDLIQFYNEQSNFAETFRFMVKKYIEEYGIIDCKYVIMQEQLKQMGMGVDIDLMRNAATTPVASNPSPVQETINNFIENKEHVEASVQTDHVNIQKNIETKVEATIKQEKSEELAEIVDKIKSLSPENSQDFSEIVNPILRIIKT